MRDIPGFSLAYLGRTAGGNTAGPAAAGEALDASVVNMRWAKPLDTAMLARMAAEHMALVTVEEGALMGGAGSAVLEYLADAGLGIPVLRLGIRDGFTEHGDPAKLLAQMGLDAAGIEASVRARFAEVLERARHPAVYDMSKRRVA